MKLCLLAAGFAKRMYPLTRDRAKPLLEVGGRPMLTRLLEQARATGVVDPDEACVCASRFVDEFRAWNDGLEVPVRLFPNGASTDEEARGAVADLRFLLREAFPDGSDDGYLVVAGDNVLQFALGDYADTFHEYGRRPLLLVRRVPEPIPPGKYSEVVFGKDGMVRRFREKPADPESPWSAIACYFLPPDLPELLDEYLGQGGEADAPGHFLQWLCGRRSTAALEIPAGAWHDVGSLEGLEEARRAVRPWPPSPIAMGLSDEALLRVPTEASIASLAARLPTRLPPRVPDWPLKVADPNLVGEFYDLYASGALDDDEKLTLMVVLLQSFELRGPQRDRDPRWRDVLGWIDAEFELHGATVIWWACLDTGEHPHPADVFDITPEMRSILERRAAS